LTLESHGEDEHSPKSSEGSNLDMGERQQQAPRNTLRTLAQPVIGPVTSCIRLPDAARNYELKMIHYNQLPEFHGLPSEDPLNFIREFYNVLNTFPLNDLNDEQMKLRCFPETLKDRAKAWDVNQDASIKCIETQLGQLAARVDTIETEMSKDKLPSQHEQAKAITVLRSGKEVDNKVQMPEPEDKETHSEKIEEAESGKVTDEPVLHKSPNPYKPRISFPDRLRNEKQEKQFRDLFYMLSKVNVNLPLLDVIKNMPSYGKFFKDLVTKKRKFEDGEKVVVYEAASAMQHDLPKKERDLGGFIIQIALGNGKVASGMLDLGAGINLMPFSIFQRLGLGDLRPTRMCLQLADRSIRYPKGIVEDVLVKVGKLIIPVDFVVLDVGDVHENGKDHTILLGRPFMATTNTLIDVKNGTLNMTVLGESVSISVREAMSSSSVNFIEECAFIDLADPFVDEMVFQ
ncbi:Unknown protein, partial [Striga hermonthica]